MDRGRCRTGCNRRCERSLWYERLHKRKLADLSFRCYVVALRYSAVRALSSRRTGSSSELNKDALTKLHFRVARITLETRRFGQRTSSAEHCQHRQLPLRPFFALRYHLDKLQEQRSRPVPFDYRLSLKSILKSREHLPISSARSARAALA